MLVVQGSLLAGGGVAALAAEVVRRWLPGGAWVDVRRAWLPDDELLARLVEDVPWRAERRPMYERVVAVPRLLAFYGVGAPRPHPRLDEAQRALDRRYEPELGEPLCTAGLCLYRDGADSVAWHGDRIGRGARADTVVAILSLGASRRFLLRPLPGVGGGAPSLRWDLAHGDLLVMGGSCQRTWQHAVPKTARPTGTRVSVQFRARGVR